MKFAHVLYKDTNLGLAHLEYPRIIKWYETSADEELNYSHSIEVIDSNATPMELAQAVISLGFQELYLAYNPSKDFPCISYLLIQYFKKIELVNHKKQLILV